MTNGVRQSAAIAGAAILAFAVGRMIPRRPLDPVDPVDPVDSVDPAPPRLVAPVAPAPSGRSDALDGEIAAHRAQNEELDAQLHGGPIPWADAAAERRAHDEMRAALEGVISDCRPDGALTAIDCSEKPCIAIGWFEEPRPVDLSACPAWTDRFTPLVRLEDAPVKCGDNDRWLLVAAPWDEADMEEIRVGSGVDRDMRVYLQQNERVEMRLRRARADQEGRCP